MAKKLVADIQELINNKADARLMDELRKIQNVVFNGEGYNLLKDIKVNIGTDENPKVICLAYILNNEGFSDEIIEKNTERYRAQETEKFLSTVESLRNDVDTLLDTQNF